MGNLFVKMPNVSELRDAKPTSPSASVTEPKWFFDIPLRTVMMVVLAAYAIIGLVNLVMSIPFLWNPIFWLFLIFDLLGFCLDVFGFLAVYRLIPEWMVTYGWALLVFLVVDVIRMVTWSVLGALGNAFATLILHAIFTFSMIGCMYSLRAYALACKGIAI